MTTEWKPIETAPKDDKQVPLWNPDNPHGEWPYMGVWDAIRQAWTVHVDGQIIYPTHWMPLPDPPTAEEEARRDEEEHWRFQKAANDGEWNDPS